MAITYQLAPIPKWIIIGNDGLTAGGAKMYTKRSLNKIQNKNVYQDAAGTIPWTNPIIFDANGTSGPFYWETNSAQPLDTYYLEAYDADDTLLWTLDNYLPPGSGGGGGGATYAPLENLIANNVFIEHVDDIVSPVPTNALIAPSNHHGFTPDLINPVVGTNGVVGPDIRFVKNNTNATDTITFGDFLQGQDPLTGDVTPVQYIQYECTNTPLSEDYKSFQFPIQQKVNNLDNQVVTFTVWARYAAIPSTILLYVRQYFGSGGAPSAEVRNNVGSMALSATWTKYTISFIVPNTAGKTLGSCGDDALYIQLDMPLGEACDVQFTKPSLYLGNISPTLDFETYDQIDRIIQSPRVADIKHSLRSSPPRGWLVMDDRTIGSATSSATNRANIDTFFLYKTIWDGVSDTWAPVTTGRGASAVADFSANKSLKLTRALGRVLAGQNANLISSIIFTDDIPTNLLTATSPASTATIPTGTPILVSNSGGALPQPLVANTVYYVINVSATTFRLADSVDNAQATVPVPIVLTVAGTGINSVQPALGVYLGEGMHTLTIGEMPTHNHANVYDFVTDGSPATGIYTPGGSGTKNVFTNNTGGGLAHNTMQPTLITNTFIKL